MVSQSDDNKFGIKLSGDQKINNLDSLDNPESDGLIETEELVRKIPLFNEKLDVTKKTEKGNLSNTGSGTPASACGPMASA
ncbi:hypothetical protein [Candidatus Nitrosocosmicus arcticus]|uniref:Uncharacterized protein n=1 Tax=Candidatus Nitrosocosmicus arcticus TaxID=2035267 RepID=A0A557SSG1_9ARCH|nr:hypothetical protein [Candidatus Nitrosocosmicus arcticus]TVP39546.1 hypothetical protein NARC_140001 [Candidatus Nitrosocosmicus arcticus]